MSHYTHKYTPSVEDQYFSYNTVTKYKPTILSGAELRNSDSPTVVEKLSALDPNLTQFSLLKGVHG